jgi:type IX secretion system PorP/SprF family membrane protein
MKKMKNMKKLILVLILGLTISAGYAQQDPIYTQYMFDKMILNPAYTGTTDALSINMIDRFQWVGMKDGPNTLCFSANSILPNPHLGVGLYTYRDALGPTVESGLMGSFSYKILFPKGKLSFGVSFGFTYLNIDWNALNAENPGDPLLNDQVKNQAAPDAGVGVYYYTNRWYVGLSSTHLLQNNMVVPTTKDPDVTSFSKLTRHFYGMAGVAIPLSENFVIRPSVLLKYVNNAPFQADFTVAGLIYNVLWIGVGYRTENCLNIMAEVNIMKNLHIGYSYDAWFNPLESYNKGSHEISIGYDFDIFKSSKMVSPRFF